MQSVFTKNPIVGTPLTPSLIRQLNDAIRRNQPIAGVGVKVQRSAGGTIISAKPSKGGGGGGTAFIHPYKCRWMSFETPSGQSPDPFSGAWAFYLPSMLDSDGSGSHTITGLEACLNFNGSSVPFADASEFGGEGNDGWFVFGDFGMGSSTNEKNIVCALYSSGSETLAKVMSEEEYQSWGSTGGFVGNDIIFPICKISQEVETTSDGTKVTRTIGQFAIGERDYWNAGDKFPFALSRDGSGNWNMKNPYYRLENTFLQTSDYPIESSWAGQFVWLKHDRSATAIDYGDISKLREESNKPDRAVIPLYKFTEPSGSDTAWGIEVDLRALPTAQMWCTLTEE